MANTFGAYSSQTGLVRFSVSINPAFEQKPIDTAFFIISVLEKAFQEAFGITPLFAISWKGTGACSISTSYRKADLMATSVKFPAGSRLPVEVSLEIPVSLPAGFSPRAKHLQKDWNMAELIHKAILAQEVAVTFGSIPKEKLPFTLLAVEMAGKSKNAAKPQAFPRSPSQSR